MNVLWYGTGTLNITTSSVVVRLLNWNLHRLLVAMLEWNGGLGVLVVQWYWNLTMLLWNGNLTMLVEVLLL